MKINLRLLHIYLAKIYPRYNLASIIKFLVHRVAPVTLHINRYVITLGLWKKYDMDGSYFRFVA